MPRIPPPESVPPMKSEDMMNDLVKMLRVLRRLAELRLECYPLAKTLLTVGTGDKVPTSKKLHQELRIAPSNFRRWLDALYEAYLGLLGTEAAPLDYPSAQH